VVLSGNSIAGNRDYASWLRVPTERVARITNAIDIEAWKPVAEEPRRELRRKLHIADGIPIVLGVFRLSEEKRPFDFIEVYRKVRSSSRPVQFLIAGEGPMQAALESLVQEYGLQDGIRFLGRRSDIRNLMSIATIVLHTSGFEGMPNAIMEAQAMGRAVVATRAGAVAEIIVHGKTGFLADVGDIDALAQYCGKLVDSPSMAEAFGSASCAYVREHFSMEQLAQRHVELLNSLRTGRSGENRQTIITAAERNLA
jgi:glycosyltransferase involved in cell wall biosynthesis